MAERAKIFVRRNGHLGSSLSDIRDTGHLITEKYGLFTVYSIHDEDEIIIKDATIEDAEKAIAEDWQKDFVR